MREVNRETLLEKIADLELLKESGAISLHGEYNLTAYKMLLATMEAEPVGEVIERPCSGEMNTGMTYRRVKGLGKMESMPVGTKIYAAQPVPVVPEEKPIPNTLSMYAVDAVAAIAEVKGWNACRAAMLNRK